MKKIYTLSSAFTLNATGEKVDAVASPVTHRELIESRHSFSFNFLTLTRKYTVYKLQVGGELTIQGLRALSNVLIWKFVIPISMESRFIMG
jgi:hypothetical protein